MISYMPYSSQQDRCLLRPNNIAYYLILLIIGNTLSHLTVVLICDELYYSLFVFSADLLGGSARVARR